MTDPLFIALKGGIEANPEMDAYTPADLLHFLGPDYVNSALANSHEFLDDNEIVLKLANFRNLNSNNKVGLLSYLARDTPLISEHPPTFDAVFDASVNAEKLKYNILRKVALSEDRVSQVMTKNELFAVQFEARALQDAFRNYSVICGLVDMYKFGCDLYSDLKHNELAYVDAVRRAENIRSEGKSIDDSVIGAYVQKQREMWNSYVEYGIGKLKALAVSENSKNLGILHNCQLLDNWIEPVIDKTESTKGSYKLSLRSENYSEDVLEIKVDYD